MAEEEDAGHESRSAQSVSGVVEGAGDCVHVGERVMDAVAGPKNNRDIELMKIILSGGSGHVGTLVSRVFHRDGHEVVVLSRAPKETPWRTVGWDGVTAGEWMAEISGADVVINLAGRSVNCRYGDTNRRLIMDLRVDSTRIVGEAISRSARPPRVWLQTSTATIYAHRFDAANDEATGILGGDEPDLPDTGKFSLDVVNAWERVTGEAVTPGTRKVHAGIATGCWGSDWFAGCAVDAQDRRFRVTDRDGVDFEEPRSRAGTNA